MTRNTDCDLFLSAKASEWLSIFNCLASFVQKNRNRNSQDLKLSQDLDWQFIDQTAEAHRILPFLLASLMEAQQLAEIPEEMRSQANSYLQRSEWQNQIKMLEFNRIQRILNEENIPMILLKGVALTSLIYQEYPFRTMGDVDILIRKEDLEEVERLMVEHGFQWKEIVNRLHSSLFRRLYGRGSLVSGEIDLDLQWDSQFIVNHQFCSMNWGEVWSRRLPFFELGENVFSLHPDDQIAYLSLQILNDIEANAPRLVQLLDLALVLVKYDVSCEDAAQRTALQANPQVAEKLRPLFSFLDECFFGSKPLEKFSENSGEFLEIYLTAFRKNLSSFTIPVDRTGASLLRRLVFIVSYFFPSRSYLKVSESASMMTEMIAYFNHWKSLANRIGNTIIS